MSDLLPLPRLDARQLLQLARSLRSQAGADDQVADSVAAALESVSRRRAARMPMAVAFRVAGQLEAQISSFMALLKVLARRGQKLVGRLFAALAGDLAPRGIAPVGRQVAARATPATPVRERKRMAFSPSIFQQALAGVETGSGLAPDLCDALEARGWVEWVDCLDGTPIDCNHPRSMLRVTVAGRTWIGTPPASSNENTFVADRLAI